MQQRPSEARGRDAWVVQRAIVLQVLRDDHEQRWSPMELAREISDFEPAVIEHALARLVHEGVVHRDGARVRASRAARCLDELELIGV
jgi:DNA-binding HxlR family transcriptional regulator